MISLFYMKVFKAVFSTTEAQKYLTTSYVPNTLVISLDFNLYNYSMDSTANHFWHMLTSFFVGDSCSTQAGLGVINGFVR